MVFIYDSERSWAHFFTQASDIIKICELLICRWKYFNAVGGDDADFKAIFKDCYPLWLC